MQTDPREEDGSIGRRRHGATFVHAESGRVRVEAPAKVNLFLEVLRRRPDGFHDLQTVMVAVGWYDTLALREGRTSHHVGLTIDPPSLPTDSGNLVTQAAELLSRQTGCRRGVAIHLTKRIPVEAGLGGGSSDAAAALVGLNVLWQLGLRDDELRELGRRLGSDVAFFLTAAAAVCRGRGDQVEPLVWPGPMHVVIVVPRVGVSTARVFQSGLIDLAGPRQDVSAVVGILGELAENGAGPCSKWARLGRHLFNRLEAAAYALNPQLEHCRNAVAEVDGCGHAMSGSGSAHFVLCRNAEHAGQVAQSMSETGLGQVVQTTTVA